MPRHIHYESPRKGMLDTASAGFGAGFCGLVIAIFFSAGILPDDPQLAGGCFIIVLAALGWTLAFGADGDRRDH